MNSITLMRRIAARPSIVFEALTTAEGVAAWWGPDDLPLLSAEVDARVGGAFHMRFRTADGIQHKASGEFLVVDPPRRLVMSWRWVEGGEPDEVGRTSRVEIDLKPVGAGVELTFIHADLATPASEISHRAGWTNSVEKLVRRVGDPSADVKPLH
jgi:uncharacterized protein YndB with AHSA1/START domain